MRQTLIAGNWKMNGTLSQAESYLDTLLPHLASFKNKVLLAVPFTLIPMMAKKAKGTHLRIGAQNMSDQDMGAFTGEISCSMLQDAGASFVVIGHSERRQIMKETNEIIHKKVLKALSLGMQPILCIGETLAEKESGTAKEVLLKQLKEALDGVSAQQAASLIIAYEPVWAIGTGMHATPELASSMHNFCKEVLLDLFGKEVSDHIPLLYGGSVKGDNIAGFLQKESINGALVGGASLDPLSFLHIIQSS